MEKEKDNDLISAEGSDVSLEHARTHGDQEKPHVNPKSAGLFNQDGGSRRHIAVHIHFALGVSQFTCKTQKRERRRH